METNVWTYEGAPFTDPGDYFGFVYIIRNRNTGRSYIGKKLFTKAGYKTVKGKRKKLRVTSGWENYYGSSPALQRDLDLLGPDAFDRRILYLCRTRGECNYVEAREQFLRKVLEDPDGWYNENIYCRIHRSHLKKSVVQINRDDI